ncbi:hypothetical protein M9Y10_009391 [Tritrichomonas musculus]|uniref:Uncharacterized protein n=1 Tax=Tritrichomonas musculus TaxID=1915356 RepID=A0ABR2GLK9_9EUKA
MSAGRNLINNVIRRLNMTEEDMRQFTPPKAIYQSYTRRIIYDLKKYELDLFTIIAEFPKTIKTVKDRQKVLIMFIEKNPKYMDNNYITIWFRFAEDYATKRRKVKIIEYEFENARRNNDPEPQMSFSNFSLDNSELSNSDEEDLNEEEEMNSLCQCLKMLKI